MKRPAGVIVTTILQVLGSLFMLLMSVLIVIAPRLAPKNAAQPQLPAGFFLAISAMYLVFAGIGLATAIGVFQLKRWARYSTLTFAGFLAGFGLLLAVIFLLMPFPASPTDTAAPMPASVALLFKLVMALMQLALAALGAWWLYYFNRAQTKLRFAGEMNGEATEAGRRPLSIAILAVLSLFGVPWMLVAAWLGVPISFFGILMEGNGARIAYLLFAALGLYIGMGLWRLVPASRLLAIALYVFGCVNSVLFYALPGREARYHRLLTESSQMWHFPDVPQQTPQFLFGAWAGIVGSLIVSAVAIYYLVTRYYAFQPESVQPSDQPPVFPVS